MSPIFTQIYCLDLDHIFSMIIALIMMWSALEVDIYKYEKKTGSRSLIVLWKCLNAAGVVISVFIILYLTVMKRSSGEYALILTPLWSFKEAKVQPELYREMLMNMFLFLPFGLTMSTVLPDKLKLKAVITVLIAIIISVFVEAFQYYYQIGHTETDDVLANTAGAMIGCIPYLISKLYRKYLSSKCD